MKIEKYMCDFCGYEVNKASCGRLFFSAFYCPRGTARRFDREMEHICEQCSKEIENFLKEREKMK